MLLSYFIDITRPFKIVQDFPRIKSNHLCTVSRPLVVSINIPHIPFLTQPKPFPAPQKQFLHIPLSLHLQAFEEEVPSAPGTLSQIAPRSALC